MSNLAVVYDRNDMDARPSHEAAIDARALWKTYRVGRQEVHALRGVDLRIGPSEFVAIMGPSGCGKSTLLHTLGALQSPSTGSVLIEGTDLAGLGDAGRTELRRRRIGFVFQRFNLLPTLTVEGNLRLAERICLGASDAPEVTERRLELLSMLGLAGKLRHKPMELSGGEQQRVAIARALIHEPAILLADEPTGNLDSENSENVLSVLEQVHAELGQTIVMITHDADVAHRAERIVRMKDGAVLQS